MENECEVLPGVAYPGVQDNRSTLNTKTGYDDDDVSISTTSPQSTCHSAPVTEILSKSDHPRQK